MATYIWPGLGSGGGGGGGGGSMFTLTISGTTIIQSQIGNQFILANSSAGGYTVTLPDAVANAGYSVTIKNFGSPTNLITVATQGGQTIDEFSTDQLSNDDQAATYTPVAGEWYRSG